MCRNLSVVSSSHRLVPPSLLRNCQPVVGMTVWPRDLAHIHPMVVVASGPRTQRPVPETIVAELLLRIRHYTCTPTHLIYPISLPWMTSSRSYLPSRVLQTSAALASDETSIASGKTPTFSSNFFTLFSISSILIFMSSISFFMEDSADGAGNAGVVGYVEESKYKVWSYW